MAKPDRLTLLPFDVDPLEALAQRLLQDQHNALPRLEQVMVLLPDAAQAPRLRQLLRQQAASLGHAALLGPQILGWRNWLQRQPVSQAETISDYRRELILIQALRSHTKLFGEASLWALADSLLNLFDELTLNRVGLPDNLADFRRRVASGYGLGKLNLAAMEREAQLVHTLWHAWHQEMHERGTLDRNTHYLLQLAASLENTPQPIYLLAPADANRAEREWLAQMLSSGKLTLLLPGHLAGGSTPVRLYHPETPLRQLLAALQCEAAPAPPDNAYSLLLDSVFTPDPAGGESLLERATAFAQEVPQSPLSGRLTVYAANDDEEEAQAVELQVRRWLLEGKQRIAIVTENRRLARRVRALLERAHITLEDAAGWALSTTSAAAALERWLQCIEEDFPYRAMLDLLKSPFICSAEERDDHLARVYRLEQDIVLHENIGNGIGRYRRHLKYRQHRLPPELAANLQPVAILLEQLEQAAVPFQPYLRGKKADGAGMLELLLQSLAMLGIEPQLVNDAAGMRLLEELHKMQQAGTSEKVPMEWLEFRNWLGRSLERYDFKPGTAGQAVSLMGLMQSPLGHFDALVLAAVEQEHLPGLPAGTPFFNDAVRRELALPTADEQLAQRFYHFRRLLEAAPTLLLTHRRQHDGEEVAPSPWLELLQAFHQFAYRTPLTEPQLEQLLSSGQTRIVQRQLPLPEQSRMPRPSLTPDMLPKRYSASAYQQLVDCPYQFYAARGLDLAPPETIRDALEKSDYGERVHRCLQALHSDVADLPGPFTGSWEPAQREAAIRLLEEISAAVFARDLEDNFLHRGWLQRWLEHIPDYIDWQLERAADWQVCAVEQSIQQDWAVAGATLQGRLDRLDSSGERMAIVDYKTGRFADQATVLSGEAVQLPFYALLAAQQSAPIDRVEYLSLDEPKVVGRSMLEGEELETLAQANGDRLANLHSEISSGAEMPAWGDEAVCNYCRMAGLCRQAVWRG